MRLTVDSIHLISSQDHIVLVLAKLTAKGPEKSDPGWHFDPSLQGEGATCIGDCYQEDPNSSGSNKQDGPGSWKLWPWQGLEPITSPLNTSKRFRSITSPRLQTSIRKGFMLSWANPLLSCWNSSCREAFQFAWQVQEPTDLTAGNQGPRHSAAPTKTR